jgi:hypothetical protein
MDKDKTERPKFPPEYTIIDGGTIGDVLKAMCAGLDSHNHCDGDELRFYPMSSDGCYMQMYSTLLLYGGTAESVEYNGPVCQIQQTEIRCDKMDEVDASHAIRTERVVFQPDPDDVSIARNIANDILRWCDRQDAERKEER